MNKRVCADAVDSPDLVLDKADPGDDVAARFDDQHSYAAINAIRLITGNGDCIEIICENHEDFLLKNGAGKLIGTQIKTRKIALPPSPSMLRTRRIMGYASRNGNQRGSSSCRSPGRAVPRDGTAGSSSARRDANHP
ncbi:DUF4297 domain-containing protein [Sinorhizobium meliloti]|nr:DUF4297 domain-containing protein [Sinorhizobium meliloti]MDW9782534.1 DUF4297 domain-containing protein [Sinorhizobium meliloti]MQV20211.1 DUF4297 domain-containing protein [Sinorhizobium meliloti]MQX31582.1 DUF4297 domain-containing protein [Sinorhizobium meliloti]RVL03904.1 DUF4297 domain-containing protein [Sinorhizobium meliloti]